jgi:hypothetical protein
VKCTSCGSAWRDGAGARAEFGEFVRRYLAYAEGPELEAGLRLALGRSAESRDKLAIALARPMGRRWGATRAPREAAPEVGAKPDSAALRAALAQAPGDFALASQVTVALASEGDLNGALASAESQAAQRPDDPHVRAVLAHLWERAGDPVRAKAELARALAIVASGEEYAALRAALNQRLVNAP